MLILTEELDRNRVKERDELRKKHTDTQKKRLLTINDDAYIKWFISNEYITTFKRDFIFDLPSTLFDIIWTRQTKCACSTLHNCASIGLYTTDITFQ